MRRWVFSGPLKGYRSKFWHRAITIWDFGLFFLVRLHPLVYKEVNSVTKEANSGRKPMRCRSNQLQFLKGVLDGIKDLEER